MKSFLCLSLFLLFASNGETAELIVWSNPPGHELLQIAGHSWIELIDDEDQHVTYEQVLKGILKNAAVTHSYSISYSWEISEEKMLLVIDEMEGRIKNHDQYNVIFKNCATLVRKAMTLADIPHPDFIGLGFAPQPQKVCHYLDLLNEGLAPEEIALRYLDYPSFFTPVGTKLSLKLLAGIQEKND